MIKLTLAILLFPCVLTCRSQVSSPVRGEFAYHSNGLMYPDTTMRKLTYMVDSLNLLFKTCDNNQQYISCPQGKVYVVRFASTIDTMASLRKDLNADVEFGTFISRYRKYLVKMDTTQSLIKIAGSSRRNYYVIGNPSNGYDDDYTYGDTTSEQSGRWTWSYSAKDEYQYRNEIEARYLPSALADQKISSVYGRYIQYVDCMIDTTVNIFLGNRINVSEDFHENPAITKLNEYLNIKMHLKRKKNRDSLLIDYPVDYITEEKCSYAQEFLINDTVFRKLLIETIDSCIAYGSGSSSLEILAAQFVSKEKSLQMMRHRRVMGSCSQDQAPRLHARDIALMAAETNSWDIFLRAHLDIMNDQFERMSDGSYAYSKRKTYLRELELLNLNIVDMMIGLSLRAGNTAENQYTGTIWRLGWALTESKDSIVFEQQARKLMQDNELDEFNRGLIFLLYRAYVYSLPDRINANLKIKALKMEASAYPVFLRSAIEELKLRSNKEEAEM